MGGGGAWAVVVPYGLKSHLIIGQQNRKKCSILLARFEEKSTFGKGGGAFVASESRLIIDQKSRKIAQYYIRHIEKKIYRGGVVASKSQLIIDQKSRKIRSILWARIEIEKLLDIIVAFWDDHRPKKSKNLSILLARIQIEIDGGGGGLSTYL